jgi:hypothetical protein
MVPTAPASLDETPLHPPRRHIGQSLGRQPTSPRQALTMGTHKQTAPNYEVRAICQASIWPIISTKVDAKS